MLAKIYLIDGEYHMFLKNSTHRRMSAIEMQLLLKTFTDTTHYGDPNEKETNYGILTPSIGELIAQVTDERELTILSPSFFGPIFRMDTPKYLTVEEYAEKVGRKPNMIGKLCRAGRLPGAYQQGSRWLIPDDTPYPEGRKQ